MRAQESNWAGSTVFAATRVYRPTTLAEIQEIVRRGRKLKVVGARHSFNDIADSAETLIALDAYDPPLRFDHARGRVTVPAGITYARLCPQLHAAGRALHNMASLPHITVLGAVATATHGSGDTLGNLATAVTGLEVVTATGEVVVFDRDQDAAAFAGAVVGLGALGVVTRVTLQTEPAYLMQQEVYERLPMAEATANFDAVMRAGYSVSLFTDWQRDTINQLWLKHRLANGKPRPVPAQVFGARAATQPLRPAGGLSPEPCTPQLGQPGPWHERLPHFRADFALDGSDELQTEYFVPRRHAVDALRALAALGPRLAPTLKISEIRSVAADDLWLSPAYGQDIIGLHFSWHHDRPAVAARMALLEAALAPFAPRPHWGKLFTIPPAQVQAAYPRLADFRQLVQTYDPTGKFRNAFVARYIF